MAFKRSAVRSRLSPPHETPSAFAGGFFCLVYSHRILDRILEGLKRSYLDYAKYQAALNKVDFEDLSPSWIFYNQYF